MYHHQQTCKITLITMIKMYSYLFVLITSKSMKYSLNMTGV